MAPLVHTVVAGAFALASPAKAFAPQRTIRSKTISMSSADERRMLRAMDRAGDGMWNPGANPGNQMGSGRGQFTFDSNSGIGGGMTAARGQRQMQERRHGQFTFDSDSSIGGGQTAMTTRERQEARMANREMQERSRGRFTFDSTSGVGGGMSDMTTPRHDGMMAAPYASAREMQEMGGSSFTFEGKSGIGGGTADVARRQPPPLPRPPQAPQGPPPMPGPIPPPQMQERGRGRFTFDSHSGVGGGMSDMTTPRHDGMMAAAYASAQGGRPQERGGGAFTFEGKSGIGGGHTEVATKRPPPPRQPTQINHGLPVPPEIDATFTPGVDQGMDESRRGRFTFDGHSGIGGGQAKISHKQKPIHPPHAAHPNMVPNPGPPVGDGLSKVSMVEPQVNAPGGPRRGQFTFDSDGYGGMKNAARGMSAVSDGRLEAGPPPLGMGNTGIAPSPSLGMGNTGIAPAPPLGIANRASNAMTTQQRAREMLGVMMHVVDSEDNLIASRVGPQPFIDHGVDDWISGALYDVFADLFIHEFSVGDVIDVSDPDSPFKITDELLPMLVEENDGLTIKIVLDDFEPAEAVTPNQIFVFVTIGDEKSTVIVPAGTSLPDFLDMFDTDEITYDAFLDSPNGVIPLTDIVMLTKKANVVLKEHNP